MLDDEMREAAKQVGDRAAQIGTAMGDAMDPLNGQRAAIAAIMADIGMQVGMTLEVAGAHLGSLIGHGVAVGIDPNRWPDALIRLHTTGHFAEILLRGMPPHEERADFVDAAKEICRACMSLVEGCISLTVDDPARSLRRYLELLSGIVGHAAHQLPIPSP